MKTCKDCIYNEMCFGTHTDDSPTCCDFKDKSRFVELPCAKGDVLYQNGEKYIANHWNILLTAFNERKRVMIFNVEEAEKALKESER